MRLVAGIESLIEACGLLARLCVLAMVLLVAANVWLRYFLGISPVALQELEWHLISPIALLGMAYTLKHRADVRVDFLYAGMQPRSRALVDLASALLTLAIAALIAYLSWSYVLQSHRMGEGSPDPGGLPHRFLLKAFLPLGFALLALQGLADTLRAWLALRAAGNGSTAP
ncbi:TRAP transporter small permease subunit [Orrella sp. JC864]|uniref:TRAP transporter small permease subunit n=1 Tax=Orrella sp. JC864 TaxID=3120298 RepID=UPI003008FEC5